MGGEGAHSQATWHINFFYSFEKKCLKLALLLDYITRNAFIIRISSSIKFDFRDYYRMSCVTLTLADAANADDNDDYWGWRRSCENWHTLFEASDVTLKVPGFWKNGVRYEHIQLCFFLASTISRKTCQKICNWSCMMTRLQRYYNFILQQQ